MKTSYVVNSKVFAGNIDQNPVVYHDLNPPITARYIRFKPVEWQDWISMRVELYGCVQGKACIIITIEWYLLQRIIYAR